MARRSPGEGSITKRKDGRWQGSLQVDGRRVSVYGKTRTEVVTKLKALQKEVDEHHRLANPGKLTLGGYLRQWQEQRDIRAGTRARDERTAKHLAAWNDIPLAKITPFKVASFFSELKKATSPRTAFGVYRLLHKAFADSVNWGLLASNPLDAVACPRYQPEERSLWTPDQVQWFVAAMQNGQGGHYGGLFLFLLASGCRLGEALGLRWSDIDFKSGAVRIERQLTEVNGKHIEQAPKTKAGIRTIALPSFGLEALRREKEHATSVRVFVTEVGTTPLVSNLRRALHAICRRLGLPKIRVHDLRHLHLSMLAMANVPVKVAQQRAGHASAQMTMRVYVHLLGSEDRLAAEALERAIGPSCQVSREGGDLCCKT